MSTPKRFEAADDDTRTMRFDDWSKNLIFFAKAICDHDAEQMPCQWCIKAVTLVTKCWFTVLTTKYKVINARRTEEDVPTIGLDDGYFLASALLEPEVTVQVPGWGPA